MILTMILLLQTDHHNENAGDGDDCGSTGMHMTGLGKLERLLGHWDRRGVFLGSHTSHR